MHPQSLWIALFGYLVGSIPFSYLIPRLVKGIDIRKVGTGNVGGSNVARSVGVPYGVLSGLLDISKAIVVMFLLRTWGLPLSQQVIGGIAAIIGHNWSIYLGFQGGRGISVTLGLFLVMIPKITLLSLLVVLVFTLLKENALGVLLALITAVLLSFLCPACGGAPWAQGLTLSALAVVLLKRIFPLPQDLKAGRPFWRTFWNRLLFDTDVKRKLDLVV